MVGEPTLNTPDNAGRMSPCTVRVLLIPIVSPVSPYVILAFAPSMYIPELSASVLFVAPVASVIVLLVVKMLPTFNCTTFPLTVTLPFTVRFFKATSLLANTSNTR